MPIVQLGRLQQEAAQLSEHFSDPPTYLKELERMLESYADHVHRQGRVKGLLPVLFSFEVPQPVLKRLELEMALQARQQPAAALPIADALWERRTIETRLLAVRLLGAAPVAAAEVTSRLEAWADENREELLATELQGRGAAGLIERDPEALLAFARRLLAAGEGRQQTLALGLLFSLLNSSADFANLPALFSLLTDISQDPPKKLRPALADLLSALAESSPKETTYFLQQRLAESPSEGTRWVARQVLRLLPEDAQASLRDLAK
jgi:hypothetical protein